VAEASDGVTALRLVKKHKPKLALLDVRMPELDGISCLGRIKLDMPDVAVLMFSSFDNPTYLARSLALGASGYLLKTASPKQILNAIRLAAGGESIWSREELRRVTGALGVSTAVTPDDVHLTKRESEVLKQIVFGLTNREIAQSLGISYETVKEHVQHILQKLSVSDRTQAAVWAVRRNLV
jgi:DNA-binding NarL/FixJ family response regulator